MVKKSNSHCPNSGHSASKQKKGMNVDSTNGNVVVRGVGNVWAKIGFGLGIASMPLALIPSPVVPFITGIPGIIFSCLGMKSNKQKSSIGLGLSIAGMCLNILWFILFIKLVTK